MAFQNLSARLGARLDYILLIVSTNNMVVLAEQPKLSGLRSSIREPF